MPRSAEQSVSQDLRYTDKVITDAVISVSVFPLCRGHSVVGVEQTPGDPARRAHLQEYAAAEH
jgi:hypothetical protein